MLARTLPVAAALALLLTPHAARAADCVWGSFDGTRVNYAAGVLSSGSGHTTLRGYIMANGDTVAAGTPTLTAAYLDTVDIFYTSLLNQQTGNLSGAEQTALQAWVAAGGTLIVSADIYQLPGYAEAIDLFMAQGFDDVSVDDVAAAAGIARRTLFRPARFA